MRLRSIGEHSVFTKHHLGKRVGEFSLHRLAIDHYVLHSTLQCIALELAPAHFFAHRVFLSIVDTKEHYRNNAIHPVDAE